MSIDPFPEKVIKSAIERKLKPRFPHKRASHLKGWIYVDGKVVTKVKLPNAHDRVMKESKSQYIAAALKLSHDQFNGLIHCPITGPKYYEILKAQSLA